MTASFMAGYVRSSQVVTSPIILQRWGGGGDMDTVEPDNIDLVKMSF